MALDYIWTHCDVLISHYFIIQCSKWSDKNDPSWAEWIEVETLRKCQKSSSISADGLNSSIHWFEVIAVFQALVGFSILDGRDCSLLHHELLWCPPTIDQARRYSDQFLRRLYFSKKPFQAQKYDIVCSQISPTLHYHHKIVEKTSLLCHNSRKRARLSFRNGIWMKILLPPIEKTVNYF